MKNSRLVVISIGVMIAIASCGAVYGSYFPNENLYLMIAIAAVCAIVFILFGYSGHVVEKKVVETTRKPRPKKERNVAEEDSFENISSGRKN